MTLEELIALARTPLPGPPELTDEQVLKLRAARGKLEALLPSLPERLPVMPEWMRRYSAERGLIPPMPQPAQGAQPAMVPAVPPYYGPRGPSGYGPGAM
jgi:hypothetical protein